MPAFDKKQMDAIVDRFLCWKLPPTFDPHAGVEFTPVNGLSREEAYAKGWWPIGINLLTAEEARAMLEQVVDVTFIPDWSLLEATQASLRESWVMVNELRGQLKGHDAGQRSRAQYDDVLVPFVSLMRKELHANAGKGDRPGWLTMSPADALLEVYYHLSKLQKAVKHNDGPAIQEFSADVANMAMMVLDICGGLTSPVEPDQICPPKSPSLVEKTIPYWPYCSTCHTPFEFDSDGPFANCKCGTTEWGYPRPADWVPPPFKTK